MKRLSYLAFLILIWSVPAAAEEKYHPGDVAVINNILKINDAENQELARAGWEIGHPETWTFPSGSGRTNHSPTWTDDGRLETLTLWRRRLTGTLDLAGLEGLIRLDLCNNRLTAVRGLEGLTRLEELDLSYNRLTDAGDLGGLVNLWQLSVHNNELTDLGDLGGLEKLGDLILTDNRLTRLPDFSRLKNLWGLDIAGNQFENPEALETLNWSAIKSFSYSGDQLPAFSLADHQPPLFSLDIRFAPELESVDLDGRPIDRLYLHGRLTADKFQNPGSLEALIIYHDNNYTMAELKALAATFGGIAIRPQSAQTTTLGDAASGLKAGAAYRPEELSPRLAEELAAAGPGARLLALPVPDAFEPLVEDPEHELRTAFLSFENGRATFNQPGEFYLVLTTGPQPDAKQSYAVVGYLDPFNTEAP